MYPSASMLDSNLALDHLDSDARSKLQHRISCSTQQSLHPDPCDIHSFECYWALLVFAQIRAASTRLEEMIRYLLIITRKSWRCN